MSSLEIHHLSKQYGKRRGVENLTLEVKDKEFLTIFGPAGAGKTTTLNLIAGILTPDSGSICINGQSIDGLEPSERNLAMVFESYALYPQLSVFDNMAFPLRSPKFRQPEEQVKTQVMKYAKIMKIDHLLERQIQALSNGQRQRVALGRALVRSPHAFLLDEPLSHLDAKLRHSMRAELKEMRDQLGTTTIYVTHDYLEAMSLGDRIVILSEGNIKQVATPKEVYFYPASTEVAKLFGDPVINLLDARLVSYQGSLAAQIFKNASPLQIPADVAQELAAHGQEKLRIGIRPADIRVGKEAATACVFDGLIYSFEPLGSKSVLTITASDQTRIRAVINGRQLFAANERVHFYLDPKSVIYFDGDTQKRIARSHL